MDLHSGHITKPRWSPNGRLLALPTEYGSIAIFDIDTGLVAPTLGPHAGEVTSVCWDPEAESLLTGSLDRSIGLWELKGGKRAPFDARDHKEPVHSVEWTDEGAYAMSCSTDRVRAFDGYCLHAGWTEEMEDQVNRHTGLTAASCSYQTTFLLAIAAENGNRLVLASILSADLLDSVRMSDPVRCLAWSPTEELLAVGTGRSILAFHAASTGFEGPARELTGDALHVHALAFSGDGALLASHDPQGLRIWDVKGAKLIAALPEKEAPSMNRRPSGLAFHPTRPLLAAVSPNGKEFRILDLGNLA